MRSARFQLCASRNRAIDNVLGMIDLALVDQWPERDLARRGIADRKLPRLLGQPPGEFLGEVALHQDTARRHADLSLVKICAPGRIGDSDVEIGIVEHDQRVLAAQLQGHFLEMTSGQFADLSSCRRRTREGDHRDVWVAAQGGTGVTGAGQNMQHALGQASLGEQLRDDDAATDRGAWVWLNNDGIANRQRRRDRAHREVERKVERGDDPDDPERQTPTQADAITAAGQHQSLRLGRHRRGFAQAADGDAQLELSLGAHRAALPHDPVGNFRQVSFRQFRRLRRMRARSS